MYREKITQKPSQNGLTEQKKKSYSKPDLTSLGTIADLTLGQNGSNIDGRCTRTKKGNGFGTPKHCEDRGAPLY